MVASIGSVAVAPSVKLNIVDLDGLVPLGKFLKGPRPSGDLGDLCRPGRQCVKEMDCSQGLALGSLRLVLFNH